MKIYNRWLCRLFLFTIVASIATLLTINVLIDPYGEYNIIHTTFNKQKFFQTQETIPYKMYSKLNKNKYTLVFGTSHSSVISQKMLGDKVLNMSVSVYGNPIDVYWFLSKLNKNELNNIDKIYFLLDYHTFNNEISTYSTKNFNSKGEFFIETLKNINETKLNRSLDCVIKNITKKGSTEITDNGEYVYLTDKHFKVEDYKYPNKVKYTSADKAIEYLAKLDSFCKENNVKIVYFNTTFSTYFLQNVDYLSLEKQFQKITSKVDGLYSFLYIDSISNDLTNFRDPTHNSYETVKKQMDILENQSERTAYYVTKHNLSEYLNKIKGIVNKN